MALRNKGLSLSDILKLLNELDSKNYTDSDSDCEIDDDDSVNQPFHKN